MPEKELCQECVEAEEKSALDLARLLKELGDIKRNFFPESKELSDNEIIFLCLSLCSYSIGQIAYYFTNHKIIMPEELLAEPALKKMINNINSEMSKRISPYLKKLLDLPDDKYKRRPGWSEIIRILKERGYTKISQTPLKNEKKDDNNKGFFLLEGNITLEEMAEIFHKNGKPDIKIRKIM
ncbi:hypothetical protein QT979_17370 [Microcoleus sp. w2-18bC1]|uniref:hypothetical protein n=1 Tax=unclassified Microcoleus TaxID=2642155 RepID=UPI002FD42ABC